MAEVEASLVAAQQLHARVVAQPVDDHQCAQLPAPTGAVARAKASADALIRKQQTRSKLLQAQVTSLEIKLRRLEKPKTYPGHSLCFDA